MSEHQLIDLAHAYLDRELSINEVQQLEQALLQNDEFCRWFADLHQREVALQGAIQLQDKVTTLKGSKSARFYRRRALFHRVQKSSYFPLATAALLMLSIIGLSTWYFGHASATQVTSGIATVTAAVNGYNENNRHPLVEGERLRVADQVTLGAASQLRYEKAGAQIDIITDSTLTIGDQGPELSRGAIDMTVDHQPLGQYFRVITKHSTITVIGTRFTVKSDHQQTRVTVGHGIVEMQTPRWSRRLTAGESASSLDNAPASLSSPAPVLKNGILFVNLIDPANGRPVLGGNPLRDGATISLNSLTTGAAGLFFQTGAEVLAVTIKLSGPSHAKRASPIQSIAPFTYPNERDGHINNPWVLIPGVYQVVVQAFLDDQGNKPVGGPFELRFTVTGEP
jgi:hypothetical protein